MKIRRGFTLVELLVVIGIISLLFAILLPVLASSRNRAKTAVCTSNLSQVGKAIALYAADYDDRIPYAPSPDVKATVMSGRPVYGDPLDSTIKNLPDLRSVLKPYGCLQAVFICPLDRISPPLAETGHKATYAEDSGSSYSYDNIAALQLQASLASFSMPAQHVLSWDIDDRFHDGGRNALMADLHVKMLTPDEQPLYLDGS